MHEALLFFFQYSGIFIIKNLVYPWIRLSMGPLFAYFLIFLESGPFEFITPKDSNYFWYIDDILLIYPRNND